MARPHRPDEQQKTAPEGAALLGGYVLRWLRGTRVGLQELAGPCTHVVAATHDPARERARQQ